MSIRKILFKRGLLKDLPVLSEGEPAFTTDTKKVYIGASDGNVQLAMLDDVPTKTSELTNDSSFATSNDVTNAVNGIDLSSKMDAINPTGTGSFAMNMKSGATLGTNAHVEGENCTASGLCGHAEGEVTIASGRDSHAEGQGTTASELSSHAEGQGTTASGVASHAEGSNSVAKGNYSHTEGIGTRASSGYQHIQGKYNIIDSADTYAHIVGNGKDDSARSNAHTLDWSGNAWFAGKVTVSSSPTDDLDVATKQYVDDGLSAKANTSHTHNVSELLSGTFSGQVIANSTATKDLTTSQVRNIYAGTTDLTAGTSALKTGDIYLLYE
jgi:hypothetical protein